MTPLQHISNQVALASPSLSAEDTLAALRVLGFRASVEELHQVMSVSSELTPHFVILEQHFPNATKILKDFQTSSEIHKVLDKLPDFKRTGNPDRKSKPKKYAPYCEAIASKDFKSVDFKKHSHIGELFSFFWLLHSSTHASSGLIVPPKLADLLDASIKLTCSMWKVVEDNPSFGTSWKVSLKGNLSDWITEASTAVEQASERNFVLSITSQDIKDGFEEARHLISQLVAIQPINLQEIEDIDEPEPRLSDQRGVGLDEHERLTCHHNAFQNAENKVLAEDVTKIIVKDFEAQPPKLFLIDVLPPYYIEASLIAFATATGRTIEGAIKFPLGADSAEFLESKLVSGIQHFNYPIWHRKISTKYELKIPLPIFLKQPIGQLFRFDESETIEDCLPYSITDWNTRCLNWLKKKISGSFKEIDRRIRDALVREIYKSTASPALLTIIATPISKINFNNESLSHYVNPLDKRTLDTYKSACKNIFGHYGAPSDICELFANSDFAVSQAQHRKVVEYFQSQIAAAEQSDDFIAHHNWIARYILMLLIVATGHRKSLTPFYFPWDILTEENLAFLSDKLTVGSEARFVPIPDWLVKLILDYREHLSILSRRISPSAPQLALQIQHLANGGDLHVLYKSQEIPFNSLTKSKLGFGIFFKINGKLKGKTISTADLEKSYSSVYSGKIGEFRKSAANSLWSNDYSGHQVEAFLGHNGKMHSFGESSAWSISGWADGIYEWQEEYLDVRGWKSIQLTPSATKQSESTVPAIPLINTCGVSYEGRYREKQQSLDTVTKIIRENLPPIWFLDKESKITDADIKQLRGVIESRLQNDPGTFNAVNLALATEIEKIRNQIGKVQSAIINLTRTEPCPIAIFASRHYAIASAIRKWWLSQVGTRLDPKSEDVIDRLAEIGISLIIFDALLDKTAWEAILEEIAFHETTKAHGCLTVRAQVHKHDRIYEKELILSPHTSALIFGFKNLHPAFMPSESTFKKISKDILQRINKRLLGAPTAVNTEKVNLAHLIIVFKSWWQIRLPGAQYSVAVGEHSGPAADTLSACAMYEIPCGVPISYKPLVVSAKSKTKTKSNSKIAQDLFKTFLNIAEGKDEKKNTSTRYQRQRLTQFLRNLDSPKLAQPAELAKYVELVELSKNQQIVFLMLEFLMFLLEEGGVIKGVLRFSAIRTYYSNIQDLIDILWDKNVLDFKMDDYDKAYRKLAELKELNKIDLHTPLSRFHQFMRETYRAPPSLVADTLNRVKSQCRASLITPAQQDSAWENIGDYVQDDGQIINHSRKFLYLMYNHAMRNKEAYGIRLKHVIADYPIAIRIARNATRDLKTGKSYRVTHSMLAPANQENIFKGVVELARKSRIKNAYLFNDPELKDQLYPLWEIDKSLTNALRGKTGNLNVVPYSMRHSAATRLVHWAFVAPRPIPLSSYVEKTMKGTLKEESIFACFENGFAAWPFWIDRVGMYVGHAGSNTLLNTYWHTSSLRLAEHTWFAAEESTIPEPQLAKMLGLDRTTVYYQRLRLLADVNPESSYRNNTEMLITHYVIKSNIPVIGYYFKEESTLKPAKHPKTISDTDVDTTGWIAYDTLLRLRLEQSLTFEQIKELAPTITINKNTAQKFISVYSDIVDQTGFTDFEPAGSPLINVTAKRNNGVTKGAIERERGISAAHRLVKSDGAFAKSLIEFLDIWASRVDPNKPWFVARDEREFHLIVDLLLKIGVYETQLGFSYCNFDLPRLSKILTKQQLASATESKTRFSYGHKESPKPEIGILVNQQPNSIIGDNRDTHRLVLMLAAISRTELI